MTTALRFACGVVLACTVAASVPAQTLDKKVRSLEAAMKIAAAAEAAARVRHPPSG